MKDEVRCKKLNESNVAPVFTRKAFALTNARQTSFISKQFDGQLLDVVKKYVYPFISSDQRMNIDRAIHEPSITKAFYNVEAMDEGLNHFRGSEVKSCFWNKHYKSSLLALAGKFKGEILRPIVYNCVDDYVVNLTNKRASAGAIAAGSKFRNAELTFKVFNLMKSAIQKGIYCNIPAMTFHRAQISKYVQKGVLTPDSVKYKDRVVWGLDAATIAIESQYALPMMELFSHKEFYAGGKSPLQLRSLIASSRNDYPYWTSLDFSVFDQTVPSWMIYDVFKIIKSLFPERCKQELNWIADNFVHTKIVTHRGEMFQKHKGIPSGSFFTQLVGSMCNYLIISTFLSYYSECFEQLYYRKHYQTNMVVMGDDNLVFTDLPIDVNILSVYVKKMFGMTVNPEKTDSGFRNDPPKFLKRQWFVGGEGRDLVELLVNSLHPERRRVLNVAQTKALLFGLMLTYNYSFPQICYVMFKRSISKEEILYMKTLSTKDLPGSFRAYGTRAWDILLSLLEKP